MAAPCFWSAARARRSKSGERPAGSANDGMGASNAQAARPLVAANSERLETFIRKAPWRPRLPADAELVFCLGLRPSVRQRMKYSARVGNKTRVVPFVAAACFLTCAPMPLVSSRASAMDESRADELAPGSYVWNPSLATEGPLSMRVRLPSQTAYVYRGDTLIGVTTIASGKPGYETPDGTFTVLEKERFHNSNKYDNAPMPYMQRLTWYGLALHGGHPHGYPASHGCIRLPMGFAAALFREDTKGMSVVITGHAPSRRQTLIASQRKSRLSAPADDAQASDFPSGEGASDTVREPCCAPADVQASPPPVPASEG